MKIVALIYRAYDDKGLDIPYFRAIMTVSMSLMLHVAQVVLIFNLPSYYVIPVRSTAGKWEKWLFGGIYVVVILLAISFIFSKRRLDKIDVTQKQIDRTNQLMPVYFVLTMALLMVLAIKKGIAQGAIHL